MAPALNLLDPRSLFYSARRGRAGTVGNSR